MRERDQFNRASGLFYIFNSIAMRLTKRRMRRTKYTFETLYRAVEIEGIIISPTNTYNANNMGERNTIGLAGKYAGVLHDNTTYESTMLWR